MYSWLRLAAVVGLSALLGSASWSLNKVQRRAAAVLAGVSVAAGSGPLSLQPVFAIDALDGALKAMTTTSEKKKDERTFDDLPLASKRRRALALCKDSDARKSAKYASSSVCTNDVLNDNYRIAVGASFAEPEPAAPTMSAPAAPTKTISSTVKSASLSSSPSTPAKAQAAPVKKKVQDLSGLSPAQLKRRSIAACKKKETRQAANMGSESRCTEQVMKGNYGGIVEALEFGK